jgi:myosin heavy subunit
MLETTRIRREGYSVRPRYEEFVERYRLLAFSPLAKVEAGQLAVQKILRVANITGFLLG